MGTEQSGFNWVQFTSAEHESEQKKNQQTHTHTHTNGKIARSPLLITSLRECWCPFSANGKKETTKKKNRRWANGTEYKRKQKKQQKNKKTLK